MPLLQLIAQIGEVFEDNRTAGYPFEIIVISSDTGGTTDATKVAEQARQAEANGKKVLILCTYKSAPVAQECAQLPQLLPSDVVEGAGARKFPRFLKTVSETGFCLAFNTSWSREKKRFLAKSEF